MEKYKVCPNCGKHNSTTLFECLACSTDLTSVPIVDEETENLQNQAEPEAPTVKICSECGAENQPATRKCTSCGEDISDVMPTPKCVKSKAKYILSEVSGEFDYEVSPNKNFIIGRENVLAEYAKPFVSRTHAKIELIGEELFITDLGSKNSTYINDKAIPANTPIKIRDNDEIGLGGRKINGQRQDKATFFVVRKP